MIRWLRVWNVLSLLAVAGVALSAAAIALIIGTSETQLAAGRGGSADLFCYPWFIAGLVLATTGVIAGVLAIGSAVSQSAERKKPHLSIEVGHGVYELETDSKTFTKLSVRVRNIGPVPLTDVRVLLLGGNPVNATYWLRAEHDEVEPFTRSVEGQICPVGESLFFRVAETSNTSDDVTLGYAHWRLPGEHKIPIPAGGDSSTFVMLRAEGRRIDDNGLVFARADVELFTVYAGPGGLRLKQREMTLPGDR
jgi:hypothetical protein